MGEVRMCLGCVKLFFIVLNSFRFSFIFRLSFIVVFIFQRDIFLGWIMSKDGFKFFGIMLSFLLQIFLEVCLNCVLIFLGCSNVYYDFYQDFYYFLIFVGYYVLLNVYDNIFCFFEVSLFLLFIQFCQGLGVKMFRRI